MKNNLPTSRDIDKIICFNLGSMERSENRSAFVRHLAVYTIAHHLQEYYSKNGKPGYRTKIMCQDEYYTQNDINILKALFVGHDCSWATDTSGITDLTTNSLVFGFSKDRVQPVRQIICDRASEMADDGPAAVICYPESDGNCPDYTSINIQSWLAKYEAVNWSSAGSIDFGLLDIYFHRKKT